MTLPRAHLAADTSRPLLDLSVGDCLRAQAERVPDRPALLWRADTTSLTIETLSYRELLVRAENVASGLLQHAVPGDRIGIWSRNSAEWVVLEHACALAGMVVTAINTGWTDDEVAHALGLTTPAMVFASADTRGIDLRERAERLARGHGCLTGDLDTLLRGRPPVPHGRPVLPDVAPAAPFLIQFTSGTTGRAKGALLSHRAALNSGYIRALVTGADEHDVWCNPSPLHHIGGAVVLVLAALGTGGAYVVMHRFDPTAMVETMRATGATRTGGVPTVWAAMLDLPGIEEVLAPIRSLGLGGTSVPASLIERLQREHHTVVSVSYAQSECPMITNSSLDATPEMIATTVGVAAPHTDVRIVDASNRVVGRNEVGEVCVRSPVVMSGYWEMPEETAAVFDADGYLHTGDLGSIDEQAVLRINGRAREVIIRGGENIYPIEVEDALLRHPGVAAAAVIATPSERWGEEVAAVVQLTATGAATAEQLEAHVARAVAYFKVPRRWRFVEAFPMTASGKIRKGELGPLFDGSPEPAAPPH